MATHPFVQRFSACLARSRVRHRSPQDITWRFPPPIRSRLATCGLLALALIWMTAACSPSRPIPPVRVTSTTEAHSTDFSASQALRLDRLQAVLAKPAPTDLSGGLLIRLAFDDVADLDLFVTDPLQESVYFANSPSRSGGHLLADRRCDDPSPRVETVHFPAPLRGRYRVGVDFHGRCKETSASGAAKNEGLYVVRAEEDGRVFESRGLVTSGRFEVIVIEFDVH